MSDANQKKEDEVLRRMLATKPTPHKKKSKEAIESLRSSLKRPDFDKLETDPGPGPFNPKK